MILQKINYHKSIKINDATENFILQEIKEINELINKDKETPIHDHNDLYFTQEEVNTLLSGKSNTNHNHNGLYYLKKEVVDVVNNLIDKNQAEDEIEISYSKPNNNPKLWFKLLD